MPYIPQTEHDRKMMLKKIGFENYEDLLNKIDPELCKETNWDIKDGLSEYNLSKKLKQISEKNKSFNDLICFAGAGIYDHYIPSAVNHIIHRSEFYTAYTPYQAEVSQGTLQTIFEYQSMICELTGMEVSNASMYDASTALAEALLMTAKIRRKNKLLVSRSIHPAYIKVVDTYLKHGFDLQYIPYNSEGTTDIEILDKMLDEDVAGVAVSYTNFFGIVEPIKDILEIIQNNNSLSIVVVNPMTLSLLEPPGNFNADIVVGDGQVLGLDPSFGGPLLGIFACKKKFIRSMPGRIIGETLDKEGRRGYVMTLQTREQHIKRERATSNICTNQALCALIATVYLSLMGRTGLEKVAKKSLASSHYLFDKLIKLPGVKKVFSGKFFNEFVLQFPVKSKVIVNEMMKIGILPGVDLGKFSNEWKFWLLISVTEKRTDTELDMYIKKIQKIINM